MQYLECHLKQWAERDLDGLIKKGHTIQHRLTRKYNQPKSSEQRARTFAKLMIESKVRAALRLIDDDNNGGPLELDRLIECEGSNAKTVREILLKKHPSKKPSKQSSIITVVPEIADLHPVLFDRIDGALIHSTALKMTGAAGPSGLDAIAWKRLCSSFKSVSDELCDTLASLARRICSSFVDPKGL